MESSRLKCFMTKTTIPYKPAKEEVVNFDPRVSLFHDVISAVERETVIEIGDNMVRSLHILERSQILM